MQAKLLNNYTQIFLKQEFLIFFAVLFTTPLFVLPVTLQLGESLLWSQDGREGEGVREIEGIALGKFNDDLQK